MSRKTKSASFGLAMCNNNVRAATAVVSTDARTLLRLHFQPHLVLTIISKNELCVAWFVNFLRELPDARRNSLFKCTYKQCKYIKLLRDAGIPRCWLSSGEFTPRQLQWMDMTGYMDVSPRSCSSGSDNGSEDANCNGEADLVDESYVEATLPIPENNELPSPVVDISAKAMSDESPPVTPGPESGISMLSGAVTSNELKSRRPIARPHAGSQEQCDIM